MLDGQIAPVELKYEKAKELAGVKMIRSARSARVGARLAVEVGSWVGEIDLVGKEEPGQHEQSEVEKLKAEIQDMKKMMLEQAELIKSLTDKS